MARDYNIKGGGIVDPDKYVYRKERDMTKTTVDWDTVATELTDTINTIRDDRQTRKAEIEKQTKERMNTLQELEQYDNQSLNTKIIGMSHEAGNFIQTQNDLMRRGLISPSEFLQTSQNVSDNFKNMKNAFSKFDKDFQNAELRTQNGESNIMEQYEMMGIAGFGNLANLEYYVNPTTGTVSFVKKQFGEDGQPIEMTDEYLKDPANHLSLNTVNNRLNSKSNYISTTDAVSAEVEKLGEVITAEYLARQGVKTMEDWYQLEDSQEMMDNLIGVVANNDQQKISILSEIGYTKDSFTQDPEEAKNDPSKILMIPDPDGSGALIPQFNESQEEEIGKFVRNMFAAQISQKTGLQKGHQVTYKPPKTATQIGLEDRDKSRANLYGTVNDLVTGDPNKAESAANTLMTIFNKNKGENVPEITNIERKVDSEGITVFEVETPDGIQTIKTQHKDGTTKTTADIIKELYDNVNPYEDDVTVAIDAFEGEIGENVGEGGAKGSGRFEKIPEIDYDSPVVIGGSETGAEAYLHKELDHRFDHRSNATGEEIESAFSNLIDAVLPKVLRDNYTIRISANDADKGNKDSGYIAVYATGPDGEEKQIGWVENTNDKTTMGAWKEIQGFLNKLRVEYNEAEGDYEL